MIKFMLVILPLFFVCSSSLGENKLVSECFSDFRTLLYENEKYCEKLRIYESPDRSKKDSLLAMWNSYNEVNFDNPYLHMVAIDLYLETRDIDYLENVALRIHQVPIILTRMLENKELALEMNIPEVTISIIKQGLVSNGYVLDNESLGLLFNYSDIKSVQDFLIFYPSLQLICLEMNGARTLALANRAVVLKNLENYMFLLNTNGMQTQFDLEMKKLTQRVKCERKAIGRRRTSENDEEENIPASRTAARKVVL